MFVCWFFIDVIVNLGVLCDLCEHLCMNCIF